MREAAHELTCGCGRKWERPCVRASRAGGAQSREGLRGVSPKGVTTELNEAWGRNQGKTARQKCMFKKPPWMHGGMFGRLEVGEEAGVLQQLGRRWWCLRQMNGRGIKRGEKAMAPYSSTLAWKIPRTVEPDRLQSMRSLSVRHDWSTSLWLFTFMHWRRNWQPTPVFLPGESQGWGNLVGCCLWGCTESDTTEVT